MNTVDIPLLLQRALKAGGLNGVTAKSVRKMPHLEEPLICVGDSLVSWIPGPIGNFLGWSAEETPVYGRCLEATGFLDVYTPYHLGADAADQLVCKAVDALWNFLGTLTKERISVDEAHYDPNSDCFRCRITVKVRALMYTNEVT